MNVVDTGTDLVRVAVVLEDVQELEVGLGRFDGNDVGVEALDGGEDISKVGVAKVRVDLNVVLDARGREAERVDGPGQVVVPVGLAQGETFTDSGLVDLDGLDAGVGEVDDLVAEGERELLGLDLLGHVGTGERPVEDGDGTGQHALHGLVGLLLGVRRPADSHGRRTRDVGHDNGGTDVTRAVRLDPTELSENETVELLAKVLDHVVTLGLTVDKEVEANLVLELARVLDLVLHRSLVLFLGDLALGKLGTGKTDLLGLGERADGGGGELGQVEVLLLGLATGGKGRLARELLLGDGGDTVTDGRVGSALELTTSGNVFGVLLKDLALGAVQGGSERGDLGTFLFGKRQPRHLLGGELGLDLERDWGVEERRRGRDDDLVGADGVDGLLSQSLGSLQVVLPNVAARHETELEAEVGALDGFNDRLELLGLTVEVQVERSDGERLEVVDRLADAAVSRGDGDGGRNGGEGLVGLLEELGRALRLVEDQDGLVELDGLSTGLLERSKDLFVDGQERVEELDRLKVGGRVTRLADEREVGDGTEQNGTGLDAERLGLVVLLQPLVAGQLELGRGFVVDLDNVVVRVKAEGQDVSMWGFVGTGVEVYLQLAHLGSDNVNTLGLVLATTAHGCGSAFDL